MQELGRNLRCADDVESGIFVQLVRRIEVPAKDIKWSGGGDLVAIVGESSFYVLRYTREAVEAAVEAGTELDEDGIEDAFELQTETSEAVRTGEWYLQRTSDSS